MFSQDGKINANVLLKQVLTCKKGLAPRNYRAAGTVWIVASQLPEFWLGQNIFSKCRL